MATAPVQLNNGTTIPALGYGTWQAAPGVVGESLKHAVRAGFRHIDCAKIYRNEKEIGDALQDLFTEGVVKREDLFITTKLWNTDHDPKVIAQECTKSLERLQVGYLDLYLIHWPASWKHPENSEFKGDADYFPRNEAGGSTQNGISAVDTWHGMEALVEGGLTKSIGVSNFSVEQVDEVVAGAKKVKPVTNQVEIHPALPQVELAAGMKKHGIVLTAYCPLAIGMGPTDKGLHENEDVKKIASEADKDENVQSAADLLLRWNLQMGYIVLSKSTTPDRIKMNAATANGGLKPETMKKLEVLAQKQYRICNPDFFNETKGAFFQ